MSDWTDTAGSIAASKGLVIVLPKADELFVDIDDAEGHAVFVKHVKILGPLVESHTIASSPSGEPYHFHAVVKLSRPVKDDFERICLQALLGSDRMHELLSWRAAAHGVANATLFFELPTTEAAVAPPVATVAEECPY